MQPIAGRYAQCPTRARIYDVLRKKENPTLRSEMKFRLLALVAFAALAISAQAQNARPVQTFQTSAGPVKITPIYHATLLIEAGGKNIYLDPAMPAVVTGMPPADLILIT